jgi:hypothetical protein
VGGTTAVLSAADNALAAAAAAAAAAVLVPTIVSARLHEKDHLKTVLQSRIISMRPRLRGIILIRLRLLYLYRASKLFEEKKVNAVLSGYKCD